MRSGITPCACWKAGFVKKISENDARKYSDLAARAYESFNKRFWYDAGGYLHDVVDGEAGDDSSLRPNQLLAFSLSYPVLEPTRWKPGPSAIAKT
jgi:glycogen debranching enzyme